MNGVHDLGGMHGMGAVAAEANEPVFHHDWERRAFALTVAAGFLRRWNIDMSRHSREVMPPAEYLAATYYERWIWGLRHLLVACGLVTPAELRSGRATGAATGEEATFLEAEAGVADAVAAIAAAEAQIQGARNFVTEAEVALGHAEITAPLEGVVTERLVEVGDLALPGRPLLVLLDPKALRLEAEVREGLVARVRTGASLEVEIPAAGASVAGTVAEIIPSADPRSRTFRVRIDLPVAAGVYPGMFGRLRLPVGEREIVRVPLPAVVRVGQLQTVVLKEGDRWVRRYVTTGRALPDGTVEILSGLEGGEEIGIREEGS